MESLSLAYPVRPYQKFYVAAGYLDRYYKEVRGNYHKGIDLNLRTGGDSDLGYPVQSMFPGEIVEAGNYLGWGGIVLVRADDWVKEWVSFQLGRQLDTLDAQFSHLEQLTVEPGMTVGAGDHLGSIGKGDRRQYFAHLHLEIRQRSIAANDPQGGNDATLKKMQEYYLDPLEIISTISCSDFGSLFPPRRLDFITDKLNLEGIEYSIKGKKSVHVNRVGSKFFLRTEDWQDE